MTKFDFVNVISRNVGIPKVICEKVLDEFVKEARIALVQGSDVVLKDLFKLYVTELPIRNGFNVKKNRPEVRDATRTVRCAISPSLKEEVKKRKG